MALRDQADAWADDCASSKDEREHAGARATGCTCNARNRGERDQAGASAEGCACNRGEREQWSRHTRPASSRAEGSG